MPTTNSIPPITVRDARVADLPALIAIKGPGSEALHLDRLRHTQSPGFRYLALLVEQEVIGFACLVFQRPAYWSDAGDAQHLPQVVDLQVLEARRWQGYGSAFLRAIEMIAAQAGYRELYLGVNPLDNPRAHALYLKLGYQPEQAEPYRKSWQFTDSGGNLHSGEDWVLDLCKRLEA